MSDMEPADMGDLFEELNELEELVDSPEGREQVQETMRVAMEATQNAGAFGRVIRGFDRADLMEALLGSLLFGIPMAVEGGTQEVGEFIARHFAYLTGTFLFSVGIVIGILYVADIQDVRVKDPILGIIPRRLLGVLGISFLMALLLMTAWGRVDWTNPVLSIAVVIVTFVPMSIGAALGDILPGS